MCVFPTQQERGNVWLGVMWLWHQMKSKLNVVFIDQGLLLLQIFDLCVRYRDGWRTCQLASLHQELILKSAQLQNSHSKWGYFLFFSCVLAKKHRSENKNDTFLQQEHSACEISTTLFLHRRKPTSETSLKTFLLQLSVRNLFQWVLHSLSAAVSYFNVSSLCCCCFCVCVRAWKRIV